MVAQGIEMLVKSDILSTMRVKLIGNLGAEETAQGQTSGNGSNMSKVFFDAGIEANYIAYEVSGTSVSGTIGLEIHGTNLWLSPSEGLSR